MKLILPISVTILLITGLSQGTQWEEFTYKEGHFRVSVPQKLTESAPLLHPVGKVRNPTFSVEHNRELFRISYYCYGAEFSSSADVDDQLLGPRNRVIVALHDEGQDVVVKSERYLTLNGVRGVEVEMGSKKMSYVARFFYSNGCTYVVIVRMPSKESITEDGKKFLESFELLQ
jgi:hypothetical protein